MMPHYSLPFCFFETRIFLGIRGVLAIGAGVSPPRSLFYHHFLGSSGGSADLLISYRRAARFFSRRRFLFLFLVLRTASPQLFSSTLPLRCFLSSSPAGIPWWPPPDAVKLCILSFASCFTPLENPPPTRRTSPYVFAGASPPFFVFRRLRCGGASSKEVPSLPPGPEFDHLFLQPRGFWTFLYVG